MDEPVVVMAAVSVALMRDERVLLVRRAKAPARGVFAFPGGRVEPGETLEEAARRELFEETGLSAGAMCPLEMVHIPSRPVSYDLQVFAAADAGGEPVAGDDADMTVFVTLKELSSFEMPESVRRIATALLSDGA